MINDKLNKWFFSHANRIAKNLGMPEWKGRIPILVEDAWNYKENEVKQLEQENAKLKERLKDAKEVISFYANIKNWVCSGFTNDYVTEFKLEINLDDGEKFSEAFIRGGKRAREYFKKWGSDE